MIILSAKESVLVVVNGATFGLDITKFKQFSRVGTTNKLGESGWVKLSEVSVSVLVLTLELVVTR